ncbi:unnamed protein product [Moneuplotes crassus]|uniref:Uncharacterized protein n=1 Tax=Euplotes crassus TaxID=5936 RepID=A0AAD1XFY6_EUPCR|nr:unnamed protein product [Moneuplotes crassus]
MSNTSIQERKTMHFNLFFLESPDQKAYQSSYQQRRGKIESYLRNLRTQARSKNNMTSHSGPIHRTVFDQNRYSEPITMDYNDQDSPVQSFNKFMDMRCLRQKKKKMRINLKTVQKNHSRDENKDLIEPMKSLYCTMKDERINSIRHQSNRTKTGFKKTSTGSKMYTNLAGKHPYQIPMKPNNLHRSMNIRESSEENVEEQTFAQYRHAKQLKRAIRNNNLVGLLKNKQKHKKSLPKIPQISKSLKAHKSSLRTSLKNNYLLKGLQVWQKEKSKSKPKIATDKKVMRQYFY